MTDKELILQIRTGNHNAFKIFVEKYQQRILKTCYGFTFNNEVSKDITQDVFMEFYESINTFRNESKISTWLYQITINKSINYLNAKKRRKMFNIIDIFSNNNENEPKIEINDETDIIVENNELKMVLNKAIGSLPENQRIAFTLHKIEDFSYKEIAELMNLSLSAVESLIFKAKKRLKEILESYK